MVRLDASNTFLIFDLDDTLYNEIDYRHSGIKAVGRYIENVYRTKIVDELMNAAETQTDFLEAACKIAALPSTIKETLLWVYRLHMPDIRLDHETALFLEQVQQDGFRVAVLTDGRSITQRLKLKALGLDHLPVYISEEYSSSKPDQKRFEQVMNDAAAENYVYIADNPSKDFVAPNSLGWLTVGIRGGERNIHSQDCSSLDTRFHPLVWINKIACLSEFLC